MSMLSGPGKGSSRGRVAEPCSAPRAVADSDARRAAVVDDQPVLPARRRVMDETVGAVEPVLVIRAGRLCLAAHVLAADRGGSLTESHVHPPNRTGTNGAGLA